MRKIFDFFAKSTKVIKWIILVSLLLLVALLYDEFGKVKSSVITTEEISSENMSTTDTKVTNIANIKEYSTLAVTVSFDIDTTWTSTNATYIDFNKIGIDYKIKVREIETVSRFANRLNFVVKIGYKDINLYKQGEKYYANAGATAVLSVEKVKDSILAETGNRIDTKLVKEIERRAAIIAAQQAMDNTNIARASKAFETNIIGLFSSYNENVNKDNLVVSVR